MFRAQNNRGKISTSLVQCLFIEQVSVYRLFTVLLLCLRPKDRGLETSWDILVVIKLIVVADTLTTYFLVNETHKITQLHSLYLKKRSYRRLYSYRKIKKLSNVLWVDKIIVTIEEELQK